MREETMVEWLRQYGSFVSEMTMELARRSDEHKAQIDALTERVEKNERLVNSVVDKWLSSKPAAPEPEGDGMKSRGGRWVLVWEDDHERIR